MGVPYIKRGDLSHGLVHLTKERHEYEEAPEVLCQRRLVRTVPAFEVLKEILSSGMLWGSGYDGFVKGPQRAVCFSEVPLATVPQVASEPGKDGRYRFYGIAIHKAAAFRVGGRPVIYLPDAEAHWIPEMERWRHVRFEHGKVDWTHEREWRVPGDFPLSNVRAFYVLVWSAAEAREIEIADFPLRDRVRAVLPMQQLRQVL